MTFENASSIPTLTAAVTSSSCSERRRFTGATRLDYQFNPYDAVQPKVESPTRHSPYCISTVPSPQDYESSDWDNTQSMEAPPSSNIIRRAFLNSRPAPRTPALQATPPQPPSQDNTSLMDSQWANLTATIGGTRHFTKSGGSTHTSNAPMPMMYHPPVSPTRSAHSAFASTEGKQQLALNIPIHIDPPLPGPAVLSGTTVLHVTLPPPPTSEASVATFAASMFPPGSTVPRHVRRAMASQAKNEALAASAATGSTDTGPVLNTDS